MSAHLRVLGVAASVLLLGASAFAQIGGLNSASLPPRQEISKAPPDSQVLSKPPVEQGDVFRAGPRTYVPRRFNRPRLLPPNLFITPHLGWSYPDSYGYVDDPSRYARQQRLAEIQKGYLALDLKPASAQVYIDGAYAGVVEELRRLIPGRSLEAGVHRIELRAPGHDTATFDVRIFPGETTTYRRDLDVTAPPAPTRIAPAPSPSTFYVIPGCYAGNRPPVLAQLRRGCDPAKLRAIPPIVAAR